MVQINTVGVVAVVVAVVAVVVAAAAVVTSMVSVQRSARASRVVVRVVPGRMVQVRVVFQVAMLIA